MDKIYSSVEMLINDKGVMHEESLVKNRKAFTHLGIPVKILVDVFDIYTDLIKRIYDNFVVKGEFPSKLKLADIKPVFKKGDSTEIS